MGRWIVRGGCGLAVLLHGTLAWFSWRPPARRPVGDEGLYLDAARQLLATGTFDLEPLWPPLYPAFLALLQGLVGGDRWLIVVAQLGLLVAVAAGVRSLASRWVGKGSLADLAGLVVLLHPTLAAFSHYAWPEVLHLALWVGIVWTVARLGDADAAKGRWSLMLGALLGLALATKALLTPWLPLLLAVVAWGGPNPVGEPLYGGLRGASGRLLLATLALLLTTLPWMAWNHQRHDVFVLSDSLRFNAWVGLQDTSRREMIDPVVGDELAIFRASGETFRDRQAVLTERLRHHLTSQGRGRLLDGQLGKQYHRLFDVDSNFTHQLPGGRLAHGPKGYREMPSTLATVLRLYARGFYLGLWGLALLGLAVLRPGRQPWGWMLLGLLLYSLALFLVLHVKTRYRIPWIPGLGLWAVVGVAWLRRRLGERLGWGGDPSGAGELPADPWTASIAEDRPPWVWGAVLGGWLGIVVLAL